MHHQSFEGFASERIVLDIDEIVIFRTKKYIEILKSYRCPKFVGDAKLTLEIRVERKRNLN